MTTFLMVDVESISSSIPRSQFTEADIDRLADSILETKGLLKPLVLKKTGFETYEVINGHFEYYAAIRASEKNPRQGEMVNALIVPEGIESAAIEQVEAIQGQAKSTVANGADNADRVDLKSIESRLMNLELRVEKGFNQIREEQIQERARVDSKFRQIESSLPQQTKPLEALNTLTQEELTVKLERSKVRSPEKIAKNIVDARHQKNKQMFVDYRDVVKSVKGLGEKRILSIIDDWSLR